MSVGVLTEIMNVYIAAFMGGFDRLRPAMATLGSLLASIDILYLGFLVLLDIEAPIKGGLRKLFALTVWVFIIHNFSDLALSLVNSLAQAGAMAAGQGADIRTVLNPSAILELGFKATEPITNAVMEVSIITVIRSAGLILLTYILIMTAYVVMALNVLITMVEVYIALSVTGILIPFGIFAPTRWIAMKPLSYFLSCGLKLMVLAFLMSLSRNVLQRAFFSSGEPTLREMWVGSCCALGIAMLSWIGPRALAAGFMSGSASLGASDAVGMTAGVVMAAVSAGRANAAAGAVRGAPGVASGGPGQAGANGPPSPGAASRSSSGAAPPPQAAKPSPSPTGAASSAKSFSPLVASATTPRSSTSAGPVYDGTLES